MLPSPSTAMPMLGAPVVRTKLGAPEIAAVSCDAGWSQVGTPITAAIRYREAVELAALGLSPYAGSAFHGPPLVLAGVHAVGSMLRCAAAAIAAFTGEHTVSQGTPCRPFPHRKQPLCLLCSLWWGRREPRSWCRARTVTSAVRVLGLCKQFTAGDLGISN